VTLENLVPEPRLARYRAVVGADEEALEQFYRWAQDLSRSLFADIASLEVAMRSAMASELARVFGVEWYTRQELFDDDAARSLATAWSQNGLGTLRSTDDPDLDVIEGKLVAGLMFGFWVQILGKGSWAGKQPLRQRRIYDSLLWRPALSAAFPQATQRRDVQRAASVVKSARNRIAHHEHIVWGVPLPGQGTRLPVSAVYTTVIELARLLGDEIAAWIDDRSRVAAEIGACPVDRDQLLL